MDIAGNAINSIWCFSVNGFPVGEIVLPGLGLIVLAQFGFITTRWLLSNAAALILAWICARMTVRNLQP